MGELGSFGSAPRCGAAAAYSASRGEALFAARVKSTVLCSLTTKWPYRIIFILCKEGLGCRTTFFRILRTKNNIMKKPFLLPLLLLCPFLAVAQPTTQEWELAAGKWCQLSFYSDHVLRLQFRESGEQHLPDSHYEMVVSHAKEGAFRQVGQLPAPAFRSKNSGLRVQAQEGWLSGNERSLRRRPFVWQRALTAGAQRWSTHWSGDLKCSYSWMEGNIRGMLASGLSGFPYFNHDAGGFRGGPDDEMYIQWAMAMGSFSPIWRPHGFGLRKRWPLDRNLRCQKAALKYSHLRYRWMPYLYTQAWKAHRSGLPIARAMMIDYPEEEAAWQYDLQYLWGGDMIVAPTHSDWNTTQQIWLPPGPDWVDFWTEAVYPGGQVITYEAQLEELPLFIKRGAVIPGREYAQSTAFMEDDHLILDIYTGADGQFELYEDDGVSLAYQEGRYRTTVLKYEEQSSACTIQAAEGTYEGSPGRRSYELHFHLLEQPPRRVLLNGQALPEAQIRWEKGILKLRVEEQPVEKTLLVRLD